MKMIFRLIKPYWKTLSVSLTLKSIASLADLFLPFLIAYIIDTEIPALKSEGTTSLITLYMLGGLMILIALIGWVLNVFANRTAEKIAADAIEGLRYDLFAKIESLSANQVDKITRPSLISRMTTDTYNLYNATAMIQRLGVRAPVLLLGGIVMSLFLDPILTLVMISMLPLILIVVYFVSRKGIPKYMKTQGFVDILIRTLREYVTGARVVRSLSMEEHEQERFDRANVDTVKAELDAHAVMARINPFMHAIMNVGLVVVLIVGAFRFSLGYTKIGQIMAFVTYFTIILNAMMSITRIFVVSSRASASASRIDQILKMPKDIKDGYEKLVADSSKPHIEFDKVSFSYEQKENNLEDISFKINRGETLGIIGATGSGKTTIINLLMRFYDVDSGAIKLYGQDIRTLNQADLRRKIGVVFQNDLVFADSIYSNIQFNRDHIMNSDIEAATRIAQADFIYDKEHSFEHQMSQRGMNLSGGQKQRILIARAVAGKPDLIILDDASSALDYQTDSRMRQALKKELKETTMIIIAQRVSSLKDLDNIILIEEGKIVASGTHDTLMKESPMYQEIAYHQLGEEL
ncbi:MAG: ABC transporter ATP-binding protein [Acholeplasmataceae bacterium]